MSSRGLFLSLCLCLCLCLCLRLCSCPCRGIRPCRFFRIRGRILTEGREALPEQCIRIVLVNGDSGKLGGAVPQPQDVKALARLAVALFVAEAVQVELQRHLGFVDLRRPPDADDGAPAHHRAAEIKAPRADGLSRAVENQDRKPA